MITLATTRITVQRKAAAGSDAPLEDVDPYDNGGGYIESPDWRDVATGIRAHIASPGGQEQSFTQEVLTMRLLCDPCDLQHTDRVIDESTGDVYQVQYVTHRRGLSLDHMQAGISYVTGSA